LKGCRRNGWNHKEPASKGEKTPATKGITATAPQNIPLQAKTQESGQRLTFGRK
jgi:hypothetical protein